jgi:D-alanine-D-alanine ligase
MKKARVLFLVHKYLIPPETVESDKIAGAEWKMEWDIISTLKRRGHGLLVVGLDDELSPIRAAIDEFKPTIVYNLMEDFAGISVFDQNVVSYLELLRVPYTGCNPRGLMLSRDKALAKKVMAYHGIPVPGFFVVPRGRKAKFPERVGYPLIVKSLVLDSSRGISQMSVVRNDDHLQKRVRFIHDNIGTDAIVEQFVDGREFYVGVLGNEQVQAFPVWEMEFGKMPGSCWHIATERAKWSVKYQKRYGLKFGKAMLTKGIAARVQRLAKDAYRALNMTGYARIDMRMGPDGRIMVMEANANPQLMRGGYFAESARLAKISYGPLLEKIMSLGLRWRPERTG